VRDELVVELDQDLTTRHDHMVDHMDHEERSSGEQSTPQPKPRQPPIR
jgi:hypothetical protein